MVTFNKDQRVKLKTIFRTEVGASLLKDLKEIIVNSDNYPANANDGMLFAMLASRKEGEISLLKQLIKIGESND